MMFQEGGDNHSGGYTAQTNQGVSLPPGQPITIMAAQIHPLLSWVASLTANA